MTAPPPLAPLRLGRTRLYARRFTRNRSAVAGVVIFLLLVAYASIGGLLTRSNYLDQDFLALTQPPGPSHWL
jgi:peptide/nickel transport system permease protein